MMFEALCDSWYVCGWLVLTILACLVIASMFVTRDTAGARASKPKGDASRELALKAPPIAKAAAQRPPETIIVQRPQRATLALPKTETQLALIRLHLVALDQAIQANDFRVLHAISAPRLRRNMTADQLAWAFAPLAARRFDGAAAIVITPEFTETPKLLPGNVLNVVGNLATPRQRIDFQMQFERDDRRWKLLAMNVATHPTKRPRAKTPSAAGSKTRRKRKKAAKLASAISPRRRRH